MKREVHSVDGLVAEIRELARGKIDRSRIDEIEDEVRAHLDASIQARLEMGFQVDAEADAIKSFGDPEEFVATLVKSNRGVSNATVDPSVIAILIGIIAYSALLLSRINTDASPFLPLTVCVSACGLLVWRNWTAAKLQWITHVIAFIVGSFLFGLVTNPGNADLRLAEGADASAALVGILGIFSFSGWLLGSIARGDFRRELRRLARNNDRIPIQKWHAPLYGAIVGLTTALVLDNGASPGRAFDPWMAGSLIVGSVVSAVVLGWRSGIFKLRHIAIAFSSSIALSAIILSFSYVVSPEGDLYSRSEATTNAMLLEHDTWMRNRTASLQRTIDAERREFDSAGAPYRVRVTSLAPEGPASIVVNSRGEAEAALLNLQRTEIARFQQEAPMIERMHRFAVTMQNQPWILDAWRLCIISVSKTVLLWALILVAQGLASSARFLMRTSSKPPRRGLA